MAITFGGLATGLDTGSIVSELMKIERRPIDRLQRDKSFLTARQAAFTTFNTKLESLLSKIEGLDTADEVAVKKTTQSDSSFFTATAASDAQQTDYSIEVVSLAKQEKEVADGVVDGYTVAAGGDLILNGQTVTISAGDSLTDIQAAINNTTGIGLTASIINDGSGTPNRLILTADQSGAGGINIDGASTFSELNFTTTQIGTDARIIVDGIDIQSSSNTITDAIPGVTLNLLDEGALLQAQDSIAPGDPPRDIYESTNVSISQDDNAIKKTVEDFVSAYNDIVNYIAGQTGADWDNDSRFTSVQRKLRSFLTTDIGGTGAYNTLSEIGLETQLDGTIELNSTRFDKVLDSGVVNLEKLFAGEKDAQGNTTVEGISTRLVGYLGGVTDSTTGFLASSKEITTSNIRRIDDQVARMELRMAKREETMRAQFSAMEQLVSLLNAQSSFLSQQMTAISNMNSGRR